MTAERRELLAILRLLKSDTNTLNDKSELELIRSVVQQLKSSPIQPSESLAFPEETRTGLQDDHLWDQLDKFNDQLRQDYTCRRQMLMRRLDCTVESFKWKGSNNQEPKGGRAKTVNEQIHERYEAARPSMREEPQVGIAELLAAREEDCDALLNGVVSGREQTMDCKIAYGDQKKQQASQLVNLKQVIIPKVPDRGGRTDEIRPPPKETFGHQRGGGGGGGGRFRHHGSGGHRGHR